MQNGFRDESSSRSFVSPFRSWTVCTYKKICYLRSRSKLKLTNGINPMLFHICVGILLVSVVVFPGCLALRRKVPVGWLMVHGREAGWLLLRIRLEYVVCSHFDFPLGLRPRSGGMGVLGADGQCNAPAWVATRVVRRLFHVVHPPPTCTLLDVLT